MRLVHMIEHEDISLANVERLVFDEADKLFDDKFVQQVDTIIAACTSAQLQISLFSATMLPVVEELARSVQKDPIKIIVGNKNAAVDTVKQSLVYVGREEGKLVAVRKLVREGRLRPPVLIFVQSKERVQQLAKELQFDKLHVDVIHADRTEAQRMATVDKFRVGDVWVLITTDLMSRGMDFKAINLVINYDFPQSVSSYIHRIGRTGRAGRTGEAITLFTQADLVQLRSIANVMRQSGVTDIPEWVFGLAKATKSKRKYLEMKPVHRVRIDKFRKPNRGPARLPFGSKPPSAD